MIPESSIYSIKVSFFIFFGKFHLSKYYHTISAHWIEIYCPTIYIRKNFLFIRFDSTVHQRKLKILIFFRADSDIFSCNLQPLKKILNKKSRSQSLTKLLEVIYLSVVKLYFLFSDAATPGGTHVSQYVILENIRCRISLCVSVC